MKNLRLKAARAALDMSQQQLADAVGVSRQTINAIEKGDYNPTIRLCAAICRVLGKRSREFYGILIFSNRRDSYIMEGPQEDLHIRFPGPRGGP